MTTSLPTRLPLTGHTLHHIYGQCQTGKTRDKFIRRELALVVANVRRGFVQKVDAVRYLDQLRDLMRTPK